MEVKLRFWKSKGSRMDILMDVLEVKIEVLEVMKNSNGGFGRQMTVERIFWKSNGSSRQ